MIITIAIEKSLAKTQQHLSQQTLRRSLSQLEKKHVPKNPVTNFILNE